MSVKTIGKGLSLEACWRAEEAGRSERSKSEGRTGDIFLGLMGGQRACQGYGVGFGAGKRYRAIETCRCGRVRQRPTRSADSHRVRSTALLQPPALGGLNPSSHLSLLSARRTKTSTPAPTEAVESINALYGVRRSTIPSLSQSLGSNMSTASTRTRSYRSPTFNRLSRLGHLLG
jgi:hypothetical protein